MPATELITDYLYTGQRQEAELGLYYYVARWYDPAIGRFIQADTIVPNPASAKGFDRYAYVGNNPVRYTDPSGHWYPAEPGGGCYPCYGPPSAGHPYLYYRNIGGLTILNMDDLNDVPFRYKDGTAVHTEREVYRDYLVKWGDRESWGEYGSDNKYTLEEHLSFLMLGESANVWPSINGLNESEVREYYEFSEYLRLDPESIITLLSFIVRHYESVDYAVGNHKYQADTWGQPNQVNVSATMTLINYFQNPPAEWTTGWDRNGAYWSGNDTMFDKSVRNAVRNALLVDGGKYIYDQYGNFYVMSGCVWLLYTNGNLTTTTITTCPAVRGQ